MGTLFYRCDESLFYRCLSEPKPVTEDTRRIYVDADACPFKDDIIEIAAVNGWAVTMVATYNHEIEAPQPVEVVRVDCDREAVDIMIANRATARDIVVTQDYGLAALVLGKGARALSPRGRIFDVAEIGSLLDARHHAQKTRRSGGRLKGPPPLRRSDREQFRRALEGLVKDR
jgi:hypothetical protein